MAACIVCQEEITHPLCAACLSEAVMAWLRERGAEALVSELRMKTLAVHDTRGNTRCIKCHQGMALCSYCYFHHIEGWLLTVAPRLVPEFRRFFGFELREDPITSPQRLVKVV